MRKSLHSGYKDLTWHSEEELGLAICNYLKDEGWTVYPELENIDIIAVKEDSTALNGKKIIGVECKLHMNLQVLHQAYERKIYVDEMFIAVPALRTYSRHRKYHGFGIMLARQLGLGVLLGSKDFNHVIVEEKVSPVHANRLICSIEGLLDPEAENYANAGQAGGKQWTAFRRTVTKLTEYVSEHPGCSLKKAIDEIDHHYNSKNGAINCLRRYIKGGVIKDIEIIKGELFLKKNS